MCRVFLFVIVLTLGCLVSQAQKVKSFPFRIEGTINADTGTVELTPFASKQYYLNAATPLTGKVTDKKFVIEGYLNQPTGFTLSYNDKIGSGRFVVQKGLQSLLLNLDSNRQVPLVNNSIMTTDYREFKNYHKEFNHKSDSLSRVWDALKVKFNKDIPKDIQAREEKALNDNYKENDRLLLNYVSAHPDSYYAFWELVRLMDFGYENIFDSIFYKFSDSIKNTHVAKILSKNLVRSGKLGVGKQFPLIPVVNIRNEKLKTEALLKNKYTLIDFWYSNCGPCLAQVPDLKVMYKLYHPKGFEIIGISTDRVKDKKNWLNVIQKEGLHWPQFWDIDGKESANLSVIAFPTNFLLDSEGKILRKNIRTAELQLFLSENIN